MPTTTITESIPELLTNFDIATSQTVSNLTWKIDFNGQGATTSTDAFIETPAVFGQKIVVNDHLEFKPSTDQLSDGQRKIYTNPGVSSMTLLDNVSGLSSFEISIDSFSRSTNYYMRSFDLFEKISTDLLGDSYVGQEDFFGYVNDNIEIGIVLLKAPPQSKIRNPISYLDEIINRGAVGGRIGNSIDSTCQSSLLSEDERIITLVYKKNGKYYNDKDVEILPYVGEADKLSFNYSGSKDLKPLNLANVGYDGRYLDNFQYDTRLISYNTLINNNRALNTIFYPKKEHNTVENVYSINSNNPFKIISSVKVVSNIQIISFIVMCNGHKYTTNPIAINTNGALLKPVIRSRDFSNNPTMNISEIIATFSDSATIDVNFGAYLTKNISPIILPTVSSLPVDHEVSLSTNPLVISMLDINSDPSTIEYSITKNGSAYASGTYSTPINITTPGTYVITAYSANTGNVSKNSENITYSILVYKKATDPSVSYDILTLDGLDDHTTIQFTSPEGIDIYFTTNGDVPNISAGNCYVAHSGSYYNIYDACTLKFFAYDGEYLKSNVISFPLNIVKTNTLSTPTIVTSNAISSDRLVLEITNLGGDIYYTLDGTTPTKYSTKYVAGHYIFPNRGDSTIIVKAISHMNGFNDSAVATKTFTFSFSCSPWDVAGNIIVGNNTLFMSENSSITRNLIMNPNYALTFEILGNSGLGILEISFKSLINDFNNYTGKYSLATNPIISTTYSGIDYSVYALGIRRNKYETNNYNKYGELLVSSQDTLKVTYNLKYIPGDGAITIVSNTSQVITLPGSFYYKLRIANSNNSIETDWILIPLASIDYQKISVNSLVGNSASGFTIGNLKFSCV